MFYPKFSARIADVGFTAVQGNALNYTYVRELSTDLPEQPRMQHLHNLIDYSAPTSFYPYMNETEAAPDGDFGYYTPDMYHTFADASTWYPDGRWTVERFLYLQLQAFTQGYNNQLAFLEAIDDATFEDIWTTTASYVDIRDYTQDYEFGHLTSSLPASVEPRTFVGEYKTRINPGIPTENLIDPSLRVSPCGAKVTVQGYDKVLTLVKDYDSVLAYYDLHPVVEFFTERVTEEAVEATYVALEAASVGYFTDFGPEGSTTEEWARYTPSYGRDFHSLPNAPYAPGFDMSFWDVNFPGNLDVASDFSAVWEDWGWGIVLVNVRAVGGSFDSGGSGEIVPYDRIVKLAVTSGGSVAIWNPDAFPPDGGFWSKTRLQRFPTYVHEAGTAPMNYNTWNGICGIWRDSPDTRDAIYAGYTGIGRVHPASITRAWSMRLRHNVAPVDTPEVLRDVHVAELYQIGWEDDITGEFVAGEAENCELLATELNDWIQEAVIDPPPSDATFGDYPWQSLEVTIPGSTFFLQDGSYAPLYPLFKGAYVFDTHLKKWGRYVGDHKRLLDYQAINTFLPGEQSHGRFGVFGGILDTAGKLQLFNDNPAGSYIKYGKIGYYRQGMTSVEEVRVHHRTFCTGTLKVESSLEGKKLTSGLLVQSSFVQEDFWQQNGGYSGRWHNVVVEGQFDISYLEFRGFRSGKR